MWGKQFQVFLSTIYIKSKNKNTVNLYFNYENKMWKHSIWGNTLSFTTFRKIKQLYVLTRPTITIVQLTKVFCKMTNEVQFITKVNNQIYSCTKQYIKIQWCTLGEKVLIYQIKTKHKICAYPSMATLVE